MKRFNTQLIRYPVIILIVVITSIANAQAQDKSISTSQKINTSSKSDNLIPLPDDLTNFFSGEWEGEGQFSNGKEIKADVKFRPELDNQWLFYSHQDRVPNKYKAIGMWGFERASEKFIMVVQDNFGGARRFESDEGWKDGKVVFVNSVVNTANNYSERFTFERQTKNSFKMTYEKNRNGKNWLLGDYLIFKRKP